MSKDTPDTFYVAPDALDIIQAKEEKTPLRDFVIPFKIEGRMRVQAKDLEAAQLLAENIPTEHFAHYGDLETYEVEVVQ